MDANPFRVPGHRANQEDERLHQENDQQIAPGYRGRNDGHRANQEAERLHQENDQQIAPAYRGRNDGRGRGYERGGGRGNRNGQGRGDRRGQEHRANQEAERLHQENDQQIAPGYRGRNDGHRANQEAERLHQENDQQIAPAYRGRNDGRGRGYERGGGRGNRNGQGRGDRRGQEHRANQEAERLHQENDQQIAPGYRGRNDGRGRGYERGGGRGNRNGQGRGDRRGQERNDGHGQGHRHLPQRNFAQQHQDQRPDHEHPDGPGARPRTQQREHSPRPPGYKALESLLNVEKKPAEVVQELSSFGKGLESLLRARDIRRDMMALLIQVLAKVCECDTSPISVVRILSLIINTDFLSRNLSQHINSMMTEVDDRYLRRAPDQIGAILKLMETLMQRVNQSMKDVHVILTLSDIVAKRLETKGYPLNGNTKILLSQLLLYCLKIEQQKAQKTQRQRTDQEAPPPNDFRGIPIFPDVAEITTNADTYLRANVVHGRYKDLDHYLDVQFRLLRQDFLEPLKLGIAEYHMSLVQTDMKRKLKDICIYHDVAVHFPICTNDGITHRVSFDITKFRKVRWQSTKRLTFGSLVCLSKDDFQSVIFATVANRNPKELAEGLIDLRFQDMRQVKDIESSESFIMAESSAYFEAYRHVLQGLQEVREATLPLQRYIIEVSSEVRPPEYLRRNAHVTYNLSPLSLLDDDDDDDDDDDLRYLRRQSTKARKVEVLNPASWPQAEALQLDESQHQAVQAALTQELAIIQGPPGTGKTYIGLKIVQVLLHNKTVWNDLEERTPILVVCYTNHALDQFLEGILEFTKNIVRVGGRSNSEDLKNKNLNFLKREQRRNRTTPRAVHFRTGTVLREMYSLRQCMEVSQKKVERSMNGIISEDYLQPFMLKEQYATLTTTFGDYCGSPTSCILEWLGLRGNFRIAEGQEVGFAANFWQVEEQVGEEQEEEEEEIEVEEEAEAIAGQRILDDEEEDLFIFEEEPQESHIVLDIDDIGTEQPDQDGWQIQGHQRKKMRKMLLHNLRKSDRMSERNAGRIQNVWALRDLNTRWQLYRFWVSEYCKLEQRKMDIVQEKYENLSQELQEVRVEEDVAILCSANVIGMTTTGAAKHRNVLQRVGPKIVVVEEAAEVLESHIVTTLSADCQHLILIGDHQQLRPNPTVYRLAKHFNLDISLFERMINNDVPYQSLVQQHRMRPEISAVMKNHFYPNLQDHESVMSYPKVAGISSDVFFLDHDIQEENVDDTNSKSNLHEVEVLVALCKYLIQQGQYTPSQITILTTYVGQLFHFKRRMPKTVFDGVRVCAVDSFQGEENDIILLSLVRSNEEGNIGFLKVSNRMCVALSRARHGFFCIGNFQALAQGESLWHDIVQEMQGRGLLGRHLSLVCHNHPKTVTHIKTGYDFLNVPEGGCDKPCEFRRDCGHSCSILCHPTDPEHKDTDCLKNCERVFKCGHKCRQKCFQTCGKCTEKIVKMLTCGHQQKIPCYQRPETASCSEQCLKRLPCGHPCKEKCGSVCTVRCQMTTIHSDWPCKHVVGAKCSEGPEHCPKQCAAILECSHQCQGTCGSCKRGRLHVQCKKKCNRILVCGHECTALCTRDCPPCSKKCENRCVHSKCNNRCGDACTPCKEPCPWRCLHFKCSKQCSQACDRRRCNRPCPVRLKCGHPCIGLCGEPCPDKCRVCDKEDVTEIFLGREDEPDAQFVQLEDCRHIFEVQDLDYAMTLVTQDDDASIKLKECPRCTTPIRRNLRYGNTINETLTDIEKVKSRIFGDKGQIKVKREQIDRILRGMQDMDHIERQMKSKQLSLSELLAIENQLNLLTAIKKTKKKADVTNTKLTAYRAELAKLQEWLMKPRLYLSIQELDDCNCEIQRLSLCIDFVLIKDRLPKSTTNDLKLKVVEVLLMDGKRLEETSRQTIQTLLNQLKQQCTGLCISEEERVMILKAMDLTQGHWFKCPNGHVYAIGDCGGATEESKCPDCKAMIGGTSHRLTADNNVATEMDGARYGAFSAQADLANYDPFGI